VTGIASHAAGLIMHWEMALTAGLLVWLPMDLERAPAVDAIGCWPEIDSIGAALAAVVRQMSEK
jgi:hypothetical protein